MRITGGLYRNQQLLSPKGRDVRPASDKVRQAVFNSLQSRIDLEGAVVFDGFSGTGSYGLEALSRGAAHCTFIDKDRRSIELCKENIRMLGLEEKTNVIQSDILKLKEGNFEITLLFLDPPYKQNLLLPALKHLQKSGWLAEDAICVLECEKKLKLDGVSRIYGETQIIFIEIKKLIE